MINLTHLSKGKELPLFQHFSSAKASYKFVNAWGKMINAETLLGENMFVACMERLHLLKLTCYDMILYQRNIKVH